MICIALVLSSLTLMGQGITQGLVLSKASDEEVRHAAQQLDQFVESLREQGASGEKHLAKVFRKVHSTYLKKYEAYVDVKSLFTEGSYDCLTATMVFSEVLTRLNYDFRIIETNYHIFILAETADGTILLETTDKSRGFVKDPTEIAKRTGGYRTNDLASSSSQDVYKYQYRCNLYQEISTDHLSGLLVFNQAVKAYNAGEWLTSSRLLEKAHSLYATSRCYELSDILVKTLVARKEVPFELRRSCMEHLMPLIIRSAGQVAAGN